MHVSSFKDKKGRGGSNKSGSPASGKKGGGSSTHSSSSGSSPSLHRSYSLGKKIGVTIVCALLVIALMIPSFMTLFGGRSDEQTDQQQEQTETVDSVNQQYDPTVQAVAAKVQEDPTNVTYLETLTSEYYQWAVALMNVASSDDDYTQAATQFANASQTAQTYLDNGGTSESVRLEQAMSSYYLGQTDSAIQSMQGICDDDPDNPVPWSYLGMFYAATGDNEQAKSAYQTALSKTSSDQTDLVDYLNQQLSSLQ